MGKPVEIEYLTNQYVPETTNVLKETISLFEADHPNIKVKLTEIPFASLFETIDTNLASGAPVMDLFSADAPLVPKYAAAGSILALTDYYTAEELADFTAGDLEESKYQGVFYAAPQISSSQGVYINHALFEAAGVPLPTADPTQRLTWDQIRDLAKTLTKSKGGVTTQWGLVIEQATAPYQLFPLIQSNGGQVISEDAKTVTGYLDSPAAIEAMTFYQDLYCGSKVSPQENPPDAFTSGKAAMLLGGTWHVGEYTALPDLKWSMTPHPYFKTPVTPTGSFHVAINKNTAHPAEAAEFLKFLTGTERTIELTKATNEIPARKSAYAALKDKFATPPNSIFAFELANTAVARPRTPAYGAMEDILRTSFQSIITCADVTTTLKDAATQIDRALAQP